MNNFISKESKLGCVLAPIAVPIGMLVVYLAMAAFLASFQDAFSFILISIVCTAGISLVLWLPIWYIIGYGVIVGLRFILKAFGVDMGGLVGHKKGRDSAAGQSPAKSEARVQMLTGQLDEELEAQTKLSRDQLALLNYIKKAENKGLSREQIAKNLTKNGWTNDSVNAAFRMANA